MSGEDRSLIALAAQQHGAFSIEQATDLGIDASTVRKRAARGVYVRLHRGVYAVGGSPATWQQSACGLVLSVPGSAAASHKTAAYLWDLTSFEPERAEIVTVRHERIIRNHPQIHESKDLLERDIVAVDGIRTTTAVRTIVDLGASASPSFVEHCLDTGLRTQLFTVADVRRFIARVARSGRNGIGTIRPLVEERAEWTTRTESALEDLFRRLVSRSGLPLPVEQFSVYDGNRFVGRIDFAYPDRSIAIELDGARWHMDREAFENDRRRQNQLQGLGWAVYRFTWRQLQDEPAFALSTLAKALSRPVLA